MPRRFRLRARRRLMAAPVLVLAGIAAVTMLAGLANPPSWLAWCPPWLSAMVAAVLGVLGTWWAGPWAKVRGGVAAQEREAAEQLRRHLGSDRAAFPRIGDASAAALLLGVKPAIRLSMPADSAAPLASGRSRRFLRRWRGHFHCVRVRPAGAYDTSSGLDPDLSTFVERDVGTKVSKWMRDARTSGGFLLLVGTESVGKTRLLYETARKVLPDFAVLAPDQGMGGLVNTLAMSTLPLPAPGLIVWLDQLQRFLDGPYLGRNSTPINETTIRLLLAAPTPVVILGTLWRQHLTELRTEDHVPVTRPRYPGSVDVLKRCSREVQVYGFSPTERRVAAKLAESDPRLATALSADRFNVTEALAGAPQQIDRYEELTGEHLAVVNAAIDAWRVGVRTPLTAQLLGAAAHGYLTPGRSDDTWLQPVLADLVESEGATAPLIEHYYDDDTGHAIIGYTVAAYLLQHGIAARRSQHLPALTWRALMDHTGDLALAVGADRRLLYCFAEPLYYRLAESGDTYAAHRLADLLVKRRAPTEKTKAAFNILINAGKPYGGEVYVNGETCQSIVARLDQQDHDVAMAIRRRWAKRGDQTAAKEWAELMIKHDRTDKARSIAKTLVKIGEGDLGAWWFQRLLIEQDRTDEAMTVLRAMVKAGGPSAAGLLADQLANHFHTRRVTSVFGREESIVEGWFDRLSRQHRIDEAMTVLRALVDAGGASAARLLADQLGAQDTAELRDRADNHEHALLNNYFDERLAILLAEQNETDELRKRADDGSWPAAVKLADLLAERHHVGLRTRADDGDEAAGKRLADLLVDQGHINQLRTRANTDQYAASRLVDLLVEQNRVDEAIPLVRRLAEINWWHANMLVNLLRQQGNTQEALALLGKRADAGDKYAAAERAELLIEHDSIDQIAPIVEALVGVAEQGIIARWCDRLIEQTRTADAVTVLRAWAGADPNGPPDRLIDTLIAQNLTEDALALQRAKANTGDATATHRLAQLLVEHGRLDELQCRANARDINAADAFADILANQDRLPELWDRAYEYKWDWCAAGRLARLLVATGRLDELRDRADAGDDAASSQLANLLAEQGRLDELRTRTDAGDVRAAWRLTELLDQQRRPDELWDEVDAGTLDAGQHLIDLLDRTGHTDQAEQIRNFGLNPDGSIAVGTPLVTVNIPPNETDR